ncbi:alpha-L-rhamnosidase [Sphingobacterium olei]|uniref:alpha-L-rhamnosidase n=1 Tax=Sphingobacterium olei TaxID=2571155 RepID=A0A4U0P738_9SPHI|nr:family 78 glycoside hydrolase catalytic domain [Sphingobacterium olei]TJZ63285.1 alpha-L-rhamnosidase [Sphingobacterium olei]
MNLFFKVTAVLLLATASLFSASAESQKTALTLQPGILSCEYISNPLGLETATPRFSWTLAASARNQMQQAYEILVSDNLKDAQSGKGNMWQPGKINSDQSLHVTYAGKPLKSFKRYYWRIRVYNQDGISSPWSKPVWFETAMLNPGDWTAQWIGDGSPQFEKDEDFYQEDPSPLFRKQFRASKKPASARLYISGHGYYEAYINGEKVGDHVLDPGWTSRGKQALYSVYDVTPLIRKGNNTTGVMLGNGFYNPLPLRLFGAHDIRRAQETGRPCLKAEIHITYTDGTTEKIITDESWMTAPGPIIRNSVYLGEHYDATKEVANWNTNSPAQTLAGWKKAVLTTGPTGKLSVQMQPPVRITKVLQPIGVKEVKPGTFVFDMGQNFAGVARIKVQGPAGKQITLKYGEDVYKDGSLNFMTAVTGQIKRGNGGPGAPQIAWQEDSYILKGSGVEIWSPRFTFHSFRYVEVTGWPGTPTLDAIEGLRMNADLEQNGTFSCSNPLFNKINDIAQWTFLSNVFSVQSDCPAREKLGYGGDIVGTAETFIYNYDMANFYKKAIQDFRNDQRANGGFTETAPYVGIADHGQGGGTGPLGWQLAYPFMLKQLYDFYGDRQVIEEGYPAFRSQMDFLKTQTTDYLFYKDIGDHEALGPKPDALTAALFYYHHAILIAEFAEILGKSSDAADYKKLAETIKAAVNQKYAADTTGKYDNGTQSAQIFALYYDMPDTKQQPKVFTKLEEAFAAKDWHLSTGIFATKMMFDVLRRQDQNEMAYRIANQRGFPGWGHMVANGATTLWETWAYSDNTYSQNHPMFGSIVEWYYRSLLGINSAGAAFQKIIIKPQPAGDLTWAKGSYQSVRGDISSSWQIEDNGFKLDVQIPANCRAEIWLPLEGKGFSSKGKKLERVNKDITFLRKEPGYAVYEVGSGEYSF